jgi:hypothetical protein
MINLNPAIEQKINQFILKPKINLVRINQLPLLSYQTEAKTITQETNNLR